MTLGTFYLGNVGTRAYEGHAGPFVSKVGVRGFVGLGFGVHIASRFGA